MNKTAYLRAIHVTVFLFPSNVYSGAIVLANDVAYYGAIFYGLNEMFFILKAQNNWVELVKPSLKNVLNPY